MEQEATGKTRESVATARALIGSYLVHYIAYVIMQTLALYSETAPGSVIYDRVLAVVPVQHSLQFLNSTFWMSGLLLSILYLSFFNRAAAIDYLRLGAVISILRGIFIFITPLGAVGYVPEIMQNLTANDITFELLLRQWLPVDVLWGGSGMSAAYLTRDLFFSGHTSSTFLFLLVIKKGKTIQLTWFFIFHLITVAALILTHEHYTIDILGAYFIVYSVYKYFEARCWLFTDSSQQSQVPE